MSYGCVIVGAILLTCIAVFAIAVVKAVDLTCPFCKSERVDDLDTHFECRNCGSRWS